MKTRVFAVACAVLIAMLFNSVDAILGHEYSVHVLLRNVASSTIQGPLPEWVEYALLIIGVHALTALIAVIAYICFERAFNARESTA